MKYSVQNYARALVEAIDAAAKTKSGASNTTIEKHFLELVRRNGDEANLGKILEEASRLARASGKDASKQVVIESARPLEKSQEKLLHQFIKTGDSIQYKINPDLVAGVKITMNDEMQFDGTMKGKLDRLFGSNI